jgi:Lon protease-like protein
MLRWCLERDRFFSVALLKPGAKIDQAENYNAVGGLGLVRACVGADDGTSDLILQGIARVKFGNLLQIEPFRIVEIGEYPSDCPNAVEAEALGAKVIEICTGLDQKCRELPPAVVEKLRHVSNPELLADIVTQTFLRNPVHQQRLLEESSVSERMRLLIRFLQPGSAAA